MSIFKLESNLSIVLVQVAFFVLTIMIVFLLFFTKKAYTDLEFLGGEQIRLVKLSKDIAYYDEVLTMSARLAVSKKDLTWEARYLAFVPFLDHAIEETLENLEQQQRDSFVEKTKLANQNLVDMERLAFDLGRNGSWEEAENVLYSDTYLSYKKKYADGLNDLSEFLKKKVSLHKASEKESLQYNIYLSTVLLITVAVMAIFVSLVLYRWHRVEKIAYEKISETNAELEEFAYRTSHDLRSPMISSIRLLDIVEQSINKNDKEKAIASLSHARGSLKKLETLIVDILALTKTKNQEEAPKEIDICTLVDSALEKLEHMEGFDRLDIQADFQFSGGLYTKESRVTMILENLISNAIKYQNPETDNPYVKITTKEVNNSFVLEVEDNGLGIPKDQQDKIFTMFKRFHPKTAFGTGLGLYLMKKSADVLNAKVTFRDNGEGSVFQLAIPMKNTTLHTEILYSGR